MLGMPRGMIFASTLWMAQMWSKSEDISVEAVGLLGLLGAAALVKLPLLYDGV